MFYAHGTGFHVHLVFNRVTVGADLKNDVDFVGNLLVRVHSTLLSGLSGNMALSKKRAILAVSSLKQNHHSVIQLKWGCLCDLSYWQDFQLRAA